jgi:hypothetical protein
MTRPTQSRTPRRSRDATEPSITIEDLEVIACVYGPGTTEADAARMQPLGAGWSRELQRWRASDAPYLLLVANTFDGGSRSEPAAVLARDRAAIERAIWASTIHADTRLCLLESFEPSLKPFVRCVIESTALPAGHA